MRPLIISFKLFELDSCWKGVTREYVDLTVFGATKRDVLEAIPDAVKLALERKYPKRVTKNVRVVESDTPQTFVAQFPERQAVRA